MKQPKSKPNPSTIPEHLRTPEESKQANQSSQPEPESGPSNGRPQETPTGSTASDDSLSGAATETASEIVGEDGLVNVEALQEGVATSTWRDLLSQIFETIATVSEGTIFDAFAIAERKREHLAKIWGEYLEPRHKLKGDEDWIIPAFCSVVYLGPATVETFGRIKERRDRLRLVPEDLDPARPDD